MSKRSPLPAWSDRIRSARHDRGITLDRIAGACGVSRPTVIEWCAGRGPGPRIDVIPALCDLLGVSPHYLVTGREKGRAA